MGGRGGGRGGLIVVRSELVSGKHALLMICPTTLEAAFYVVVSWCCVVSLTVFICFWGEEGDRIEDTCYLGNGRKAN